jgi:hypothetical protein
MDYPEAEPSRSSLRVHSDGGPEFGGNQQNPFPLIGSGPLWTFCCSARSIATLADAPDIRITRWIRSAIFPSSEFSALSEPVQARLVDAQQEARVHEAFGFQTPLLFWASVTLQLLWILSTNGGRTPWYFVSSTASMIRQAEALSRFEIWPCATCCAINESCATSSQSAFRQCRFNQLAATCTLKAGPGHAALNKYSPKCAHVSRQSKSTRSRAERSRVELMIVSLSFGKVADSEARSKSMQEQHRQSAYLTIILQAPRFSVSLLRGSRSLKGRLTTLALDGSAATQTQRGSAPSPSSVAYR